MFAYLMLMRFICCIIRRCWLPTAKALPWRCLGSWKRRRRMTKPLEVIFCKGRLFANITVAGNNVCSIEPVEGPTETPWFLCSSSYFLCKKFEIVFIEDVLFVNVCYLTNSTVSFIKCWLTIQFSLILIAHIAEHSVKEVKLPSNVPYTEQFPEWHREDEDVQKTFDTVSSVSTCKSFFKSYFYKKGFLCLSSSVCFCDHNSAQTWTTAWWRQF